jgi:hypothetical protein
MLRFMAWLCLRNDDYRNSQMVIVTGPNQELAIKLIKRMKALFADLGITFYSREQYSSSMVVAFRILCWDVYQVRYSILVLSFDN